MVLGPLRLLKHPNRKKKQQSEPPIVETPFEVNQIDVTQIEVSILNRVNHSQTHEIQVQSIETQAATENVSHSEDDETRDETTPNGQRSVPTSAHSKEPFKIPLQNVTTDMARQEVVKNYEEPFLTLASDFPNVKNIVARPDDPVDPMLQKEIEMVKDSLLKGATAVVPFTPYLSEAQKKQLAKASYATRSQGPLPTSQ